MTLLLSCISTTHSLLKKHWANSQENVACPLTTLGSYHKPTEDQGGLLCLIDEKGRVLNTVEMPMPAGMALSDNGILVASISAISEVSPDLSKIQQNIVSLPSFNVLHSLSRTQRGYLVASTGLDAILEFTCDGNLLWSWWATDHGFAVTPTGKQRDLDKSADHRGIKYGTLTQTTHVNSAAELPDGTVLASLFHQGTVIAIDRKSGAWHTVLEGLDHPHSVRVLAKDYITVADTGQGRALMVNIQHGKGNIVAEVQEDTSWLQDCSYDQRHDQWILVDGKNSRISLRTGTSGTHSVSQIDLNPEWRLYEALSL